MWKDTLDEAIIAILLIVLGFAQMSKKVKYQLEELG